MFLGSKCIKECSELLLKDGNESHNENAIEFSAGFAAIECQTQCIKACRPDGIETSALVLADCLSHSPRFVLVGVSKCRLCVSRPCPARLLPIDSRWDLSIKHPEPCSIPNPRAIPTHPLHTHTHTHFTCHPSIPPSGPLLIPSVQPFHPVQYNIRAKNMFAQV